ncbi:MAG: hypothetical protein H0X69_00200 [Gemmatimonadales bacterium]|nr:hypothetical protein [Gemmatimonadales bacterium]
MIRGSAFLVLTLALSSCRDYDYYSRISDSGGLVPADQFARYGREQAQAAAIGREFAQTHQDSAVAFARAQPDVVDAVADPLSHRVTVEFRSGWRLGVVPLGE